MVVNISDQHGRALEYAVVQGIIESLPARRVTLSTQASKDQERDKVKFDALSIPLKQEYLKCAQDVFSWLDDKYSISKKEIRLHRLTDQDARKGDVTDIRITTESETINLSVKHGHDALKHQRPPSAAQWCGYIKGSTEDIEYRKEYDILTDRFLKKALELSLGAKYFRDIKGIQNDFIETYLYKPICKHVSDFINSRCCSPKYSEHLFSFLVGRTDFYKIVNTGRETVIYKFVEIPKPNSVKAECFQSNYVMLSFSNGWEVSMRLHTAASVIGKDIKFDTRAINLDEVVPVEHCGGSGLI